MQPEFEYDVHGIRLVAVITETCEAPETVGVSAITQEWVCLSIDEFVRSNVRKRYEVRSVVLPHYS